MPLTKSQTKRNGPVTVSASHGLLGPTFYPVSKANRITYSLGKPVKSS
jgi:hypothetical protein